MFENRRDAGLKLANVLRSYRGQNCVVLALPRGGVPVAAEVARALEVPLDLLLVRKIGAPGEPELAIGSVIDGGEPIVIRDGKMIQLTHTSETEFDRICASELEEIERRRKLYLGGRRPETLAGKIVIVVDDGLATGNTMRAGLEAVRQRNPKYVVMAVPVAPAEALELFRDLVDEIVCLETPKWFGAVGYYYNDFRQIEDEEVIRYLRECSSTRQTMARRDSVP
ncbi:MAG: phosphoribosyltransferase [Alphaproteobacteria bacterium]|nr:phosphoribosyltransferase [Alphaproteobacteria bacterium]